MSHQVIKSVFSSFFRIFFPNYPNKRSTSIPPSDVRATEVSHITDRPRNQDGEITALTARHQQGAQNGVEREHANLCRHGVACGARSQPTSPTTRNEFLRDGLQGSFISEKNSLTETLGEESNTITPASVRITRLHPVSDPSCRALPHDHRGQTPKMLNSLKLLGQQEVRRWETQHKTSHKLLADGASNEPAW